MSVKTVDIKETSILNGVKSTFQNTQIIQTWSSMSRFSKCSIGIYTLFVTGTFITTLYRDGKRGLNSHRGLIRSQKTPKFENEYDAVWYNMHPFSSFWESITFPFTAVSNVMPWIIVTMNPDTSKNNDEKRN